MTRSFSAQPAASVAPPARLGVGFTYQSGLKPAVEAARDLLDYLVISPELLCRERTDRDGRRFELRKPLVDDALSACAGRPVVVHGLELSIGTAEAWEEACVGLIDDFARRCPFLWFSEHLSFMQTRDADGTILYTGAPLPLPLTDEALDIVAPRAEALGARYGVPFLLENVTHYLPDLPADGGRDEIAFLNDLTERSGCGLLLDLYNLHCNACNHGFDARRALSRLRLDRVIEIHVAGGATHDGFVMDVHSDLVPEPVWDLLDWIVPQVPNLAGVTYELLEQAFPVVGIDGAVSQLARAKQIWTKHHAPLACAAGQVAAAGAP